MNRETKRAMARQQKTADPQRLQAMRKQQLERQRAGGRDSQQGARRSRLRGVGSFGSEVVAELRKVIWPTRRELIGYSTVVLAFVTFMVLLVAAMDFVFTRAVLAVFG